MNRPWHAVKVGAGRGWTEFGNSVRSVQDQGYYLFTSGGALAYLFFNRHREIEGTDLSFPVLVIPSLLAFIIIFGLFIGPLFALALEREDGTLLRAKAMPRGMVGYVTGRVVFDSLGILPGLALILIPGAFLFDDLMHRGATGWLMFVGFLVLGILAILPLGLVVGSVIPGVQKAGTWGFLPMIVLAWISGIFAPIQGLWPWLQGVAQTFPVYWFALGMRSAFLPDSAAALELGGSWRTAEMLLVLGAWATVGLALAPPLLRRMARRQAGSTVDAARQAQGQWVK